MTLDDTSQDERYEVREYGTDYQTGIMDYGVWDKELETFVYDYLNIDDAHLLADRLNREGLM